LREEKAITQRQYDLLLLLIKNTVHKFTLKELGQEPPFNLLYRNVSPLTVRRDINRLLNLKLLQKIANTAQYRLDLKSLG
jgi:Fe2+ or Zn2+ uptake regulation protein